MTDGPIMDAFDADDAYDEGVQQERAAEDAAEKRMTTPEYADPDDMVPGEAYNAVLAENARLRMAGAGLNTMLTDAHNEIERLRAQVVSTREAWMADPFGHGGEG